MTLRIETLGSSALELDIEGKVEKTDFEKIVPLAEERIEQHGKIGLLVNVADFKGWSPSGFWEDLKFDAKHYRDISRLALVGEDTSKKWMATLSRPFTTAQVEFYPQSELEKARNWVQGERTQ